MSSGGSLGLATSTRHIYSKLEALEGENKSPEPRYTPDKDAGWHPTLSRPDMKCCTVS